ncbi:MAG: HDOD domain-containing protein [Smithellaceae bacterium]
MRHKGELPAFAQNVIEINKKLSSLQSINFSSAGDLAGVILQDMSLTNKLLKIVNASFYSQTSGKVTTVSRAVFLLGAEKVRMAAASLMIIEHLQNKSQAEELKDAAVFSFFSAVIARDVAKTMMFGSTEEVFICTLLHNLGKHLVICYFPEEYNAIVSAAAAKGIDEQSASKGVLGVSFSELGMGITRSWGFPQSIVESMDIIRETETQAAEDEAGVLKSIANYAHELCAVAARTEDAGRRDEALEAVCEKYKYRVAFPVHRTLNLIEDAATRIDQYADMFKIDKTKSPLLRRLKAYGEEKAAKRAASGSDEADGASASQEVRPRAASSADLLLDEEKPDIIKSCIAEIDDVLNATSSISDAIYVIMETMYRGFEFNRVMFCMADQSRTKMSARFGFGEGIDAMQGAFEFRITRSSDYFNVAVMRMKDIMVNDCAAPGVKDKLPEWYLKIINVRSFLIYPLVVREKCIGLLYADKKIPEILHVNQLADMNYLRDKAVWTILHKH